MTTTIIIALLLSIIALIAIAQYIKNKRAREERQFEIFVTLMATRAYAISKEDAEVLDIEEEFRPSLKKERDVLDAWKQYLSFLGRENSSEEFWINKRIDLLVSLLQKMALVLNYDIDKQYIQNTCHSQIPIENFDEQQLSIRQEIITMLKNRER